MADTGIEKNPPPPDRPLTALKECRRGRMLYLRRDQYIGRALELYGEFSEFEVELFSRALRPGDVAVEVGANIGAHTVHLARLVGPQGLVVAFEPQRIIHQFLCANLALNELFNVVSYRAAAGARRGTLKVPPLDYAAAYNFGGVALGADAGEDVLVMPLDSLGLKALRLLKIDVEGMEVEVLQGARELIARTRPLLYVENDRKERSPRLISLLQELEYDLWWHTPPLFNPRNFAGNPENVFAGIVSINMFGAPKETPYTVPRLRKVAGPDDLSWEQAVSY
ncbi:MAG TPA: FkbM family methyltransferase [Stellaceae bacterium]|nr:FkbM family methyltransferase [Stellaceae bacterium]